MKKQITEKVRNYKTFSELGQDAQKKAKRCERLFCGKFGFNMNKSYTEENLFLENGKIACMTVSERNSWYN